MNINIEDPNMEKNFEISYFAWEDIEKYLEQIVDMQFENTYKFHYPEKKPDRDYVKKKIIEIKYHLKKDNTYFIGAKIADKLYGYIWCYESIFIDEKRMNINSLFVRTEARGAGLGQLLMNKVKKIAKENDCDTVGTHYASFNTSAGNFYSKNGFNSTRIEMVCKLK
jgi:GNAT superfamily N-acetyltransferase